MKNCASKNKCIVGLVAVFIFVFFYDWLVHGQLLAPLYAQTPNLWRPMSEMQTMMPLCLLYHFLLAVVVTSLYSNYKNYDYASCPTTAPATPAEKDNKCCPRARGICFGTHIGIILGLVSASGYIWLPINSGLAFAWFLASFFQGLGIGLVLSFIFAKKEIA